MSLDIENTGAFIPVKCFFRFFASPSEYPWLFKVIPTMESIASCTIGIPVTFEINGIWDVIEIQNNKNVLMLKYEDFVNDFDVIFNGIEKFFIQERSQIDKKQNPNLAYSLQASHAFKASRELLM